MQRRDGLDPLPFTQDWPSLRSATGRVDIHSLAAFFAMETRNGGDYFEFGVGKGRSAVSAVRAEAMYQRSGSLFHLYDSFTGLPELHGRDADFGQFKAGDFAFSEIAVRAFLEEHRAYPEDRFRFTSGAFDETLRAPAPQRAAAIVHVDCDLYSSTRLVLPYIQPCLRPGTLMLFDDWNLYAASPAHGERAAVAEWLVANTQIRLEPFAAYSWCGQAFVVQM